MSSSSVESTSGGADRLGTPRLAARPASPTVREIAQTTTSAALPTAPATSRRRFSGSR